ncbi:MAG: hypothetical protein AAGD25_41060 [Cyanobacteria bacterium P01_F01_bin.150]
MSESTPLESRTEDDSSNKENSLGALTPSQILYLEQGKQRLYVELIQILRDRDMGWLRPLCLCSPLVTVDNLDIDKPSETTRVICDGIPFSLHDMRQSSDLLWPLAQCHIVLDMDAIPILSSLKPEWIGSENRDHARQSLHLFVNELWNGITKA